MTEAWGAVISLGLLGRWVLDLFREPLLQWAYAWTEKNIYAKPYHPHSLDWYLGIVDAHYQNARDLFRISNPKLWISLATIAATLPALFWITVRRRKVPGTKKWEWSAHGSDVCGTRYLPSMAVMCCLGLAFADLYAYHFTNKLVGDFSTYAKETAPGPTAR